MKRPHRPIFACALFAIAALAAHTQQQSPYAGTSTPPPDDQIIDNTPQEATPPPMTAKPPAASYAQQMPMDAQPATGTDNGIGQTAPQPAEPELDQRMASDDPDGDIVHPAPLPPGTIGEGTEIRVRLLDRLSSAMNRDGDPFHAEVASDVYANNQVIIPAGAQIEGKIVEASEGRVGGRGSLLLRPETVVMPDGTRLRLYAQVTGTPGSQTRVGSEGAISPYMPVKKDSIEYGGAVGAGAITGAIVGGPIGALAGSLIGAGAITVHLLVSHPQATLDSGSVLLFTLNEPLSLVPAAQAESTPMTQPAPANAQTQN